MKKIFFIICVFSAFSFSAIAQKAEKFDTFRISPCSYMMGALDNVLIKWEESKDKRIHIIYYTGRFRKTETFNKILLDYPHRDDGLNWAKSIEIYLRARPGLSEKSRKLIQQKISINDGGFRENTIAEVWFLSKNAKPPKPTPTIEKKLIKFRKNKPFKVRIFASCYDGL